MRITVKTMQDRNSKESRYMKKFQKNLRKMLLIVSNSIWQWDLMKQIVSFASRKDCKQSSKFQFDEQNSRPSGKRSAVFAVCIKHLSWERTSYSYNVEHRVRGRYASSIFLLSKVLRRSPRNPRGILSGF